jgi:subtilisin family serine protease
MKIAIIDSGVHAAHPHVQDVAGGIALYNDGTTAKDYIDHLGHGTAVTAVIRALAPDAEVYAVRVFHQQLAASVNALVRAIGWSVENGMNIVNLSLGTNKPEHEQLLRLAVNRAINAGVRIVAAKGWLPGDLPGVTAVELDWNCPWDSCYERDGIYYACGYPRPIPGVPVEKNLSGISFAVAHVTGCLARIDATESSRRPEPNRRDRIPPLDPV